VAASGQTMQVIKREEFFVIEINHLTKKYGSHVAVDDLSLTVEPGKI
jgi:ABC-2 type transport system ATP-binding protein